MGLDLVVDAPRELVDEVDVRLVVLEEVVVDLLRVVHLRGQPLLGRELTDHVAHLLLEEGARLPAAPETVSAVVAADDDEGLAPLGPDRLERDDVAADEPLERPDVPDLDLDLLPLLEDREVADRALGVVEREGEHVDEVEALLHLDRHDGVPHEGVERRARDEDVEVRDELGR